MTPAPRRPFAIYAITRHGITIGDTLRQHLPGADLYVSEKLFDDAPLGALRLPLPLGPTWSETFAGYDCHVPIISVGAVARMIAPLLQSKKTDPAFVCVDDAARFAVCLLSGHVGRGNAFTNQIADVLTATAVITTASDVRGTLTVDILGRELGWRLDDDDRNVTLGCAAVVNEAPVLVIQEAGETTWWPDDRELPPGVSYTTSLDGVDPQAWEMLLVISDRNIRATHPDVWERSVIHRPRSLVLGIGCDRNTPTSVVEHGIERWLDHHGLDIRCVRSLATIDVKADEPALLELSARHGWPLRVHPALDLDRVEGVETPSEVVRRHVGTRSVAEAACLLTSGASRLVFPKCSHTEPDVGRSMTVAAARIPFPSRELALR